MADEEVVAEAEKANEENTEQPVDDASVAVTEAGDASQAAEGQSIAEAQSEATGAPTEPAGVPDETTGATSEPTGAPGEATGATSEPTGAPGEATEAPGAATEAPGEATEAPSEATGVPSEPTGAPSEPTGAPGEATGVPSEPTGAPGEATEATSEPTGAPGEATEAPGEATEAPGEATEAPGEATEAVSEVQSQVTEAASAWQSEVQSVAEEGKYDGEEEIELDEVKLKEEVKHGAEEKIERKEDESIAVATVSSSESGSEEEEFSPLGPVVSSLMGDSDEEEEEEETGFDTMMPVIGALREPIDREAYIEEYKNLVLEQVGIHRKNSFLSYKLSLYYKKKKMDEAFQDTENVEEIQLKYEKKLDELFLKKEKAVRDQMAELDDIKYMRESYIEQTKQREDEFRAMQKYERDTGKGLIDTRVGKPISEKHVERLIRRQKIKADEISVVRLKYIKKKDIVKNLENQLRNLETIDGKLHLIEYEQLRMENHNLSDKIEERDEELRKLRIRYDTAVQMLAHMREKSSNTGSYIEELAGDYNSIEDTLSMNREFVNGLKVKRDFNRAETMKLKNQSGLLTCTNLLIDMEKHWNELDDTREELDMLKSVNKSRRKKLEAIRKNIEYNTERGLIQEKPVKNVRKPIRYSKVYKGRPSLIEPKLNSKMISRLDFAKLDDEFD